MKKTVCLLLALFTLNVNAQSFKNKQVDLNVGLGFGTTFLASGAYRILPPISASLDVGVTDDISVGAYLGFASASWKYGGRGYCNMHNNGYWYDYTDTYHWNYYLFGIRGAFHFARFIDNNNLDLYAGLMLGERYARFSWSTDDPCPKNAYTFGQTGSGLFLSGFVGCRYRFTDKVGAFAELGYGLTFLNVGVNFKLQ